MAEIITLRFYQEIVLKLMLANKISAWPEIMGWWVLCIFFFMKG